MAEEKDLRAEEEQDGAQLENDAQDAVSEEAESEDTGSSGGGTSKMRGLRGVFSKRKPMRA